MQTEQAGLDDGEFDEEHGEPAWKWERAVKLARGRFENPDTTMTHRHAVVRPPPAADPAPLRCGVCSVKNPYSIPGQLGCLHDAVADCRRSRPLEWCSDGHSVISF
ncbi:hypothetical protein ACWD0A_33815 [Streptomyces sp. NPDC002867]